MREEATLLRSAKLCEGRVGAIFLLRGRGSWSRQVSNCTAEESEGFRPQLAHVLCTTLLNRIETLPPKVLWRLRPR